MKRTMISVLLLIWIAGTGLTWAGYHYHNLGLLFCAVELLLTMGFSVVAWVFWLVWVAVGLVVKN